MKKAYLVVLATLVVTFLATTFVYAAVPHTIRFQGKVTDKAGSPLNGSYNITFRLYESETGGSPIWTEPQTNVAVNNGIFTALLGKVTPLDLPFSDAYWLSLAVGGDNEMAPRQQLTTVGYAIHAETAENFLSGSAGLVPKGAIMIFLGTSCPDETWEVAGELNGKFIVGSSGGYDGITHGKNTHNHTASTGAAGAHNHTNINGQLYTDAMTSQTVNVAGPGGYAVAQSHQHTIKGYTDNVIDHQHSVTVEDADNRPEFVTVLFCRKK